MWFWCADVDIVSIKLDGLSCQQLTATLQDGCIDLHDTSM